MKRSKWLVLGVLMTAILAWPTLSLADDDAGDKEKVEAKQVVKEKNANREKAKGERKDKEKKKGFGLRGEYQVMVSELGLTEQQQVQLAELVKKNKEEDQALRKEHQEKKKALMEENKAAKDPQAKKAVGEKMQAFRKEEQTRKQARQDAVMALLTEEQKQKWNDFNVYRMCMGRLRVELNEEQKAKARAICKEIAPKFYAAKEEKAKRALLEEGTARIRKDVLTEEQRQKVAKQHEKREKGREGKGGEKAGKNGKDKPEAKAKAEGDKKEAAE